MTSIECTTCGAAVSATPTAEGVDVHFPGCTAPAPARPVASAPAPLIRAPVQPSRPARAREARYTVHTVDDRGQPDGYWDSTPRAHADAVRVRRKGERTSGLRLRLRFYSRPIETPAQRPTDLTDHTTDPQETTMTNHADQQEKWQSEAWEKVRKVARETADGGLFSHLIEAVEFARAHDLAFASSSHDHLSAELGEIDAALAALPSTTGFFRTREPGQYHAKVLAERRRIVDYALFLANKTSDQVGYVGEPLDK